MRLYMAAAPVAAARRRTAAPIVRADVTFVDGVQQANKARRTRARACPDPLSASVRRILGPVRERTICARRGSSRRARAGAIRTSLTQGRQAGGCAGQR